MARNSIRITLRDILLIPIPIIKLLVSFYEGPAMPYNVDCRIAMKEPNIKTSMLATKNAEF